MDPSQYGINGYNPGTIANFAQTPYTQGNIDQYGNPQNLASALQNGGVTGLEGGNLGMQINAGAGQQFAASQQGNAIASVEAGMQNTEGDVTQRNALRSQMMNQLGNMNTNAQMGNVNAQYGNQLNNSLAMARRQMGGSGLSGSQQAGANLGSIVAQSNTAQAGAQGALQQQQAQTLQGLTGVQTGVTQQELAQQGQQFGQADTLANLQQEQANSIYGYNSSMNSPAPQPFGLQQGLGDLFAGAGAASGFMKPAAT